MILRQLRRALAVTVAVGVAATAATGAAAAGPRGRAATRLDPKKGVSVWVFRGVDRALAKSGASWYFTWAVDHPGIAGPRAAHFVPMIWGRGTVTNANLRRVKREGRYLLGFNEPDNPHQRVVRAPGHFWAWR